MNCSGDMYEGVPIMVPAWVRLELSIRATPKSASFTRPSRVIITLAGLISRWITPCSWL
jgi:hypothetical protein